MQPDQFATIVAIARSLDERLARIEAGIRDPAVGRTPGKLRPRQRKALEALLPAMVKESMHGGAFSSAEIFERIKHQPTLVAVVLQGRPVDGGATRKIGRLLGQAARTRDQVGDFRVQRGVDLDGVVMWSLIRVSTGFETPDKG